VVLSCQGDLFGAGDSVSLRSIETERVRTVLEGGAWIDRRPAWVGGADGLFDRLVETVPWRGERRPMYERVVDVPRLLCFYDQTATLPHPALEQLRSALNDWYAPELGEPLRTVGMALYRDGRDSVAWHGDTIGRASTQDTVVAIVSLGSARRLCLRPRGGGPAAVRVLLRSGDLLVMGGSCQRTWEHAIPKSTRSQGARISVQFRPIGVR
jgi:alkylated DNA repair dioxygenase AlkB